MTAEIKTEDNYLVRPGDTVYNYYDCKWGVIQDDVDSEEWFTVLHEDGTRSTLNGDRIAMIDPEDRIEQRITRNGSRIDYYCRFKTENSANNYKRQVEANYHPAGYGTSLVVSNVGGEFTVHGCRWDSCE